MKPPGLLTLLFSLLTLIACTSAPIPTIVPAQSGDILYQEDFTENNSGWHRIANDQGIMDYDGGGYRILVRKPKLNVWSTAEKNFGDVRIEADVIKLHGPEANRMGLMCRYQGGDYYFFLISDDGYYAIGKFLGGMTLLLGQTVMQPSDSIHPGSVNHLRADCIGDQLTFYVNFTEVASVKDSDLPNGDVGVLAGAFDEPGVDVMFDEFVVIQP